MVEHALEHLLHMQVYVIVISFTICTLTNQDTYWLNGSRLNRHYTVIPLPTCIHKGIARSGIDDVVNCDVRRSASRSTV